MSTAQKKIHVTIEAEDELSDVVQKIKARREKRLNVAIPSHAPVMRQLVNLRILAKKAQALGKELTMLTADATLSRLLRKAGFAVQTAPMRTVVEPVQQTSMLERQPWWSTLREKLAARAGRANAKIGFFSRPSHRPVLAFALLGLILVAGIVYVTLPTATIHIKPILKTKKSSLNIVMDTGAAPRTAGTANRDIRLRAVSTTFERTLKVTPTGRIPTGGSARGKVTLFNTGAKEFPIVGNTRLQTTEGLVFLTRSFVTIPAGSPERPGTAVVEVVARDKDARNVFTGSRGNIPPAAFFLPALSEGSRRIVYGKSSEPFTGGSDAFESFVTREDIVSARSKMEAELGNAAAEELKATVRRSSEGANMMIFERTPDMLRKAVEQVDVRAKENDRTQEFEAFGRMTVSGFAFNGRELEEILRANLLTSHMSPTEKILKTKEDSLQINEVLEKDPAKGRVKVNASIEAVISYDFLNNSLDLVQDIRSAVVGKSRGAAEKYLNNLKDVSKAWVTLWPVWTPTLPTIPENIEIVIEEEA